MSAIVPGPGSDGHYWPAARKSFPGPRETGPENGSPVTIPRMATQPSSKPEGSGTPGPVEPSLRGIVESMQEHLRQLERLAGSEATAARSAPQRIEPA